MQLEAVINAIAMAVLNALLETVPIAVLEGVLNASAIAVLSAMLGAVPQCWKQCSLQWQSLCVKQC